MTIRPTMENQRCDICICRSSNRGNTIVRCFTLWWEDACVYLLVVQLHAHLALQPLCCSCEQPRPPVLHISSSTSSYIYCNYALLPYNLSTASPSLSMTSPATMERLWIANDSSAATLAMWQPPQAANMRGGSPPGNLAGSFARSWYVRIHAKWVAIAPVITSPYKGNSMCLDRAACF